MKKLFILTILSGIVMMFCQCSGCTTKDAKVSGLNIENIISSDKETMYVNYGGNYRWYETCAILNDFLDEENDGSFAEIVNIFQVVNGSEKEGFDTEVYKLQHFSDGTSATGSTKGFWIEDFPLVDSLIKVSYAEAYEKIMQVNLPKPHSKNVILRNPVGPKACNPQWVFGNIKSQIWVDATTGEINTSNPAFPEGFKMPLGEWP